MRKYADLKAVATWRAQQDRCACCLRLNPMWLQLHHLLGGRVGRPDGAWNCLALCQECHDRLGHGRENLAICLTLKRESDPENYDQAAMQAHLQRFGTELLPAPAALPDWILELRGTR